MNERPPPPQDPDDEIAVPEELPEEFDTWDEWWDEQLDKWDE
jgi:hypothetical protein